MVEFSLRGAFHRCFSGLLFIASLLCSTSVLAYSLDGTVYLDGNPLPDTTISVIDLATDNIVSKTVTDSTGHYFLALENGSYDLRLAPAASLGLSQSLVEDVQLDNADLTYHIVLIQPEVVLNGNVNGADGTPASGVQVAVYNQFTGQNMGVYTTGASGSYSIAVAKGTYKVVVSGFGADSNLPLPETWKIAPIRSNLTLEGDNTLTITLPNATLSGRITSPDGNAAANVKLRAIKSWTQDGVQYSLNNSDNFKSDADGRYELSLFANSAYTITVVPALDAGLAATSVTTAVLAGNSVQDIALQHADILSGVVRAPDGTAVQGVELYIFDESRSVSVGSTETDSNGHYQYLLSDGRYTIHAGGNGSHANIPLPSRWYMDALVTGLTLSGNQTKDLVLPLVHYTGKVVNSAGDGVAGVAMTLNASWRTDGLSFSSLIKDSDLRSSNDGSFAINLLPYTDYAITLHAPASSAYADTLMQHVNITSNVNSDVSINQSLQLNGVVRLPDGSAVAGAELSVYDEVSGVRVALATTDADGRYSFAIANGMYRMDIRGRGHANNGDANINGLPQHWFVGSIVSGLSLVVDTTQDIVLPVVRLSGTVHDSDGNAVSGASLQTSVNWTDSAGRNFVVNNAGDYMTTNADGDYSMLVFAYDDYTVNLQPPAGVDLIGENVQHVNASGTSTHDFAFSPVLIVSGKVKTPSGLPVSGVKLTVNDTATRYSVATMSSDDGGNYHFALLAGSYSIDAQGNGADSNLALPRYWQIKPLVANINLSGNTDRDIILPVVTISGKSTDSNGVSVPNVEFQLNQSWTAAGVEYRIQSYGGYYRSADNGEYQLALFPFDAYSETVIPPIGSGFATINVNNLDLTHSFKQNVILVYPDKQAPRIIAGPLINNISANEATIEWQTDEPADSKVNLSDDQASVEPVTGYSTLHSVHLTGLTANRVYQLVVSSTDAHGNGPTQSSPQSFTTGALADTQPPMLISGPVVSAISDTSAVVEWETDEPASSVIHYGAVNPADVSAEQFVSQLSIEEAVTHHHVELSGLSVQTAYALNVSATDMAGNGPVTSPIVHFVTTVTPDTSAAIIISGPMVTDITSDSATIVWQTDEPATSGVSFNDGVAHGLTRDIALTKEHSVRLTGLQADTRYQFTVSSLDGYGNGPTLSAPGEFATAALADTQAPVIILEPEVVVTTHQSAVIRWETDEPSDSVIDYGLSRDVLSQSQTRAALVSKHNLPITGLKANLTYYFRVHSTDAAGNVSATSAVYSFFTDNANNKDSPQATVTPHVIEVSDTTATLYWETDKETSCELSVDNNSQTVKQLSVPAKTKQHQLTLVGLVAGERYDYHINVTDSDGNSTEMKGGDSASVFSTLKTADTAAPQFMGEISVTAISDTSAVIRWRSDEIANAYVHFNVQGDDLTRVAGSLDFVTDHEVMLTKLTPGTPYHFTVQSSDVSGNVMVSSAEGAFVTTYNTDTTPPQLSATTAQKVTYSSVAINWKTNEFSRSTLRYGVFADQLTTSLEESDYLRDHGVELHALAQGITYYYQVAASDMAGNAVLGTVHSFTTVGIPVDTDKDGIPNALDSDDDNDGIPDTVEIANGLNSLDASDASKDSDHDGLSNLEEYQQGTDMHADSAPPMLTVPAAIEVPAQGPLTLVDLGSAKAIDAFDGVVSATQDHTGAFRPGHHQVIWHAEDKAGNAIDAEQIVDVIPRVDVAVDQDVGEGGTATVTAYLNGNAVHYPVEVQYHLGGTATAGEDYIGSDGSIVISSGISGSVSFPILNDGLADDDENIEVNLVSAHNAVLGEHIQHRIHIIEHNATPRVMLSLEQAGQLTHEVAQSDGMVAITARIQDSNASDSHSTDWSATDNQLLSYASIEANTLHIDPALLVPGSYTVKVSVTDDGIPPRTVQTDLHFTVVVQHGAQSDMTDSDEDGLSDALEGVSDNDNDGIQDYLDNIANPSLLQTQTNESTTALLMTEPGLHLQLGDIAVNAAHNAAQVSVQDIADYEGRDPATVMDSSSKQNVGGLFDFTITALTRVGDSVQVVLPLTNAIPPDAVYRKYMPGTGWSDFVEDANNKVFSATGAAGLCPEPNDVDYHAGLAAGNYCVMLLIEDGGANDADGFVNGVIKDPGGVVGGVTTTSAAAAQAGQNTVKSGSSADTAGGGGLNPVWLLMLMVFSGLRFRFAVRCVRYPPQ